MEKVAGNTLPAHTSCRSYCPRKPVRDPRAHSKWCLQSFRFCHPCPQDHVEVNHRCWRRQRRGRSWEACSQDRSTSKLGHAHMLLQMWWSHLTHHFVGWSSRWSSCRCWPWLARTTESGRMQENQNDHTAGRTDIWLRCCCKQKECYEYVPCPELVCVQILCLMRWWQAQRRRKQVYFRQILCFWIFCLFSQVFFLRIYTFLLPRTSGKLFCLFFLVCLALVRGLSGGQTIWRADKLKGFQGKQRMWVEAKDVSDSKGFKWKQRMWVESKKSRFWGWSYIYIYIRISIYVFIHMYICIYTYMHTCIHTYIHTFIHIYI